jgi:sugar O-acyltransferase (sialic acid O-acetyltransferase NeuD family)
MKSLAILGASGHGKVVADIALACGWQEVVFFDDAWPRVGQNGFWTVQGNTESLIARMAEFDGAIVAIGQSATRMEKQQVLENAGPPVVSLVHPAAYVSRFAGMGAGTVVMPGAVVNVDTVLGNGCIINSGATVDHDCVLADGVHIAPGAHLSGNVFVGAGSWVGVGAAIRQGVRIGAGVMVGAGAVVVQDIADGETVVGNPARSIGKVRC